MPTPDELLTVVRRTSKDTHELIERHKSELAAATDARAAAVQEALGAGIPRDEIARAAGTHRNNLYRLVKRQ